MLYDNDSPIITAWMQDAVAFGCWPMRGCHFSVPDDKLCFNSFKSFMLLCRCPESDDYVFFTTDDSFFKSSNLIIWFPKISIDSIKAIPYLNTTPVQLTSVGFELLSRYPSILVNCFFIKSRSIIMNRSDDHHKQLRSCPKDMIAEEIRV